MGISVLCKSWRPSHMFKTSLFQLHRYVASSQQLPLVFPPFSCGIGPFCSHDILSLLFWKSRLLISHLGHKVCLNLHARCWVKLPGLMPKTELLVWQDLCTLPSRNRFLIFHLGIGRLPGQMLWFQYREDSCSLQRFSSWAQDKCTIVLLLFLLFL